MVDRTEGHPSFIHKHSLSLVAVAILLLWIVLYSVSRPSTHLGSFFGNAIADWTSDLAEAAVVGAMGSG